MKGKLSVVAGCPFLFIEALHSITKVVMSFYGPRNGPAPHAYGPGSLKNETQVNAIK